MSNKTRVLNRNEKVGRKKYLKGLVAGFLGAAAFLKLTEIPKVAHGAVDTITGEGTADEIAYFTGTNTIASSPHLKWDNTDRNFIGGYEDNEVTTDVEGATISGGGSNSYLNKVTDDYGTIGGGRGNQAGDDDGDIESNRYATVAGGWVNKAKGSNATVGGGSGNIASGNLSTVAGGYDNVASGVEATVPGGDRNYASGSCSFAAGRRANIDSAHDGAFLFSDSHNFDFNSAAANEFAVRCTGGARFVTAIGGAGNPTKQVTFGSNWLLTVGGKSKFGGWVVPTMDNKYKLGYGKKRWKEVWAANGTIQTSLSKFKENIESPSDIDYLSTVPEPIYFNWKDGDDKQRHLGFIGDHLPEVAKEGDGGIYTSSVTAILCGAVKQLKEENKQLRENNSSMIQQLKEENRQVKDELKKISKKLEKLG